MARWTLNAIAALRPQDVAQVDQIPIDARAALIACVVTMIVAVIAGLMPSIQLSRPAATTALRDGRTTSRRGARGAMVVAEVAAALVLVAGAGLLVRSLVLIQRVDPGFSRDDVAVLQVFASPRIDTPPKRIVFFEQALDRMRRLPGVDAAGAVTSLPFGEAKVIVRAPLTIAGRPPAAGEQSLSYLSAVAGDYFAVMGVPLLKGRRFDSTDTAASQQVALVSQTAARQFWGGGDPIGSNVRFRFTGTAYDAEVIGVVGDVRHEALDRPAPPDVYVPYAQSGFRALTVVVRRSPGSLAGVQALKQQIWALDPQQSVFAATTLDHLVSKTLTGRRFSLFLLGGFALATLVLACAGVFGVMSCSTTQRTREFGVRLALGAERRDIVRLVLGEGLLLAGIGVIAGTLLALPLTRLLRTLLFGVTPHDPITFLAVCLALLTATTVACYVPARRALKTSPIHALRGD